MSFASLTRGLAAASLVIASTAVGAQTIRFSYGLPVSHNFHEAAQMLAANVAKQTSDKVKIELYPAGQLTKDGNFIKTITSGSIDAGLSPTLYWTGVMPIAGIFDVPYLITTHEQAQKVLAGPVGARLLKELDRFDLVGLGYFNYGFGIYGNNKTPLRGPKDFQGLKMRTNNDYGAKLLQSFGASPTFMSGSEVFLALERGTVDGSHTGLSSVVERKMYDTLKYLTVDNHNMIPYFAVIRKDVLAKLSPQHQKVLLDAIQEAGAWVAKKQAEDDAKAISFLRGKKMDVIELTPQEVAVWQAAASPVRTMWHEKAGKDGEALLKALEKELAQ